MPDLSDFFNGAPFNPYSVEAQEDFTVIPAGKYLVLIEKSEVRLTKKQTGHYIYLEMQVLEGPHKGRKVFDQINIQNPSAECVEIGIKELGALGQALGIQEVDDSSQLLDQIVVAHVKIKNERNEVRTYSMNPEAPALAPAPTPAPGPVYSVAPMTPAPGPAAAPIAAPVAPALAPAPTPPASAAVAPIIMPGGPYDAVNVAPPKGALPPWER